MCSVLPSPGSSITLRVSFVEIHPEAPLVRLWGLYGERREEYLRLMEEIQAKVGPRLASAPGGSGGRGGGDGDALALGDLCLVELGGRWHRCRVVSRLWGAGQDYRVFLLDEGRTVSAGSYYLARGRSELFHLPSEVLGCILADLVPPGRIGATLAAAAGESKGLAPLGSGMLSFSWTAGAVEFLGYLHGKEVTGLVREVLIPQCLVVLELPWLLAQMHHLGLASQISPSAFSALLNTSLGCTDGAPAPSEPSSSQPHAPVPTTAPSQQEPTTLDYFYPKLELNMTEPVLVTQISDPHKIYCQLRSLSKEIQLLSDVMYQAFEASKGKDQQEPLPTPGSPCAARGIDGCWYRALLLEIYTGDGPEEEPGAVAQVICVDYGRKEFVTKRNLRNLPVECFRMPVVTYPCSLQGITDGGCGWAQSQISQLKMLMLSKVVQARIEAYCPFDHLYYVTLYGDDGLNLNCFYGVQAHCLAQSLLHSNQEYTSDLVTELESIGVPAKKESGSLLGALSPLAAPPLPVVRLKAGECHRAQVFLLQDPTDFWVHLQEHRQPLCRLKRNLSDFYSQSKKLEGILLEPKPGSLCCVMLKENCYHRALVTKVQGKGIEVYLVDRGNTEIVDLYKVKELLPQFRELPPVALRCTLANPFPPSQSWSPDAVDYFKKAVLNKLLVIQVLGMQEDIYIVELFDHSQAGEKNIGKIMSQQKYAEHHETKVLETLQKMTNEPLRRGSGGESIGRKSVRASSTKYETEPVPQDNSSASYASEHLPSGGASYLPCKAYAKEDSSTTHTQTPSPYVMQNYSEIKPGFSCEGQLEVGSTVDVVVSYAESPSLFWCQLAKSSQDLKALMAKIQDYCTHSAQPYDWPNPVCLAKYSEDKKWYRALLISKVHYTEEVEVAYVDYGNKELVSLKNICATKIEFLKLKAQAFRCSLYNLIQPNGQDPFVWEEKATEAFHEFVDSASKLELKCTIFALAALNNTDLINIVDLITPFESVCHFLTRRGLARCVQPQKPLISSLHLLSYYYSTHDVKIGSEEVVYVTHVNDPCHFYCQLARSANVLGQLTSSIGKLSKMWHNLQTSQGPGNVYLAKYTDSCWYRAIVTSAKTTREIFFVDFGNTQLLKNEDLVLVPNDAYELLLLPMQAIKCSLSDVADVPKGAAVWFEKAVLDKPLKALIVAKEPDGKLIIELYDGKMQINAKLKESLQCSRGTARYTKNDSFSRYPLREANAEKRPSLIEIDKPATEVKRWSTEHLEMVGSSKQSAVCREARQYQQKTKRVTASKFPGPMERFNGSDPVAGRKGRDSVLNREETPDNFKSRNQTETNIHSSLRNIFDLPQKIINPGLKTLVYVSHTNNPSDFYVHLVEDEPLLDSISEKLNNTNTVESLNGQQLHIGDLMCAVFSEDGLWYRAVVSEEPSGELVSVQYIDYGNTALVSICKTGRLLKDCASFPVMSVHCSLGGVQTTELSEWAQEAVLYFSQRTSDIQLNCEFVEKIKGKWEINLCDRDGSVTVGLVNSSPACKKPLLVKTSDNRESNTDLINLYEAVVSDNYSKPSNMPDAKSFLWKIPKVGQTVKTFSIVAKSPGYFWCQFADKADIGSIERKLQEAGELMVISVENIRSGCPCLAKHGEDNTFCRAIICSVEGETLRVIYIDYGTEELISTEMIRQISDELLAIPPQAFLCCLFGFNSVEGSWTEGIDKIFCDMVVDSLLDTTVIERQNQGPFVIPLFVVKLECQKISINEQIKPFWEFNVEDSVSALANILKPEEQIRDGEETVISSCALMGPKDTIGVDDLLCCSKAFQPLDKCLVAAGSSISLETFPSTSPKYQTKHHQTTFEAFDTGDLQAVFETFKNEADHSAFEKERGTPNPANVSEMQLHAGSETEVLERDLSETRKETEDQTEMLTLEILKIQQHLDDTQGVTDSVPFKVVPSSDTKQLPLEWKMHSFGDRLETTEGKPPLRDETQERSELDLLEIEHVEGDLEQRPSLKVETDCLLLELVTPEVHPLQADGSEEGMLPLELPADNQIQLSVSDFSCNEDLTKMYKTGQESKKGSGLERQTLLKKNYVETQMCHGLCERFKESNFVGEDSLRSALLDDEAVEISSHNKEKSETTCNLKGFDIGSKCMVWSGVHWYKAQILGVSAEGTKVLNLSSGNEEVVSPIDVWNRIPEQDLSLTEILDNKVDAVHSTAKLPVGAKVKEVSAVSDVSTDPPVL
ncbi:tudor domain-containing protein 6 [Rhineura floridana]|uniref:tudor domain-containing protein 6 n=1 Tax=Rhineura floridana TaxID=261503 RepID=UPI002AC84028|nr:tudor domain-containing protein 6 [Rhineura floridana]